MEQNRAFSLELLRGFCTCNGASGHEDQVISLGKVYAKGLAETKENFMRNLYFERSQNKGNRPVVMIDAHSDEVSLIVQKINGNGTLSFLPLGSWVTHSLPSQRFRILNDEGEYVVGVVASKPPHFMSAEEKSKSLAMGDLIIDVGASSKEELIEKFKISIGAPCVPDVGFQYNEQNGVILTKALDNRVACAGIIDILRAIQDLELEVDVVCSYSSQEEIGQRGIKSSVNYCKPNLAIVLEGTPSDDTFFSRQDAQSILHEGTQIRCYDQSMIANPRLVKYAKQLAEKKGIPYQLAVRSGGSTNAGMIHSSFEGVPSIVLGVPTRYAHSHNCFCAIEDYESTVALAVELLKNLNEEIIKTF